MPASTASVHQCIRLVSTGEVEYSARSHADVSAAQIKGLDAWGHAYLKAKKVVDRLTLEEKVRI